MMMIAIQIETHLLGTFHFFIGFFGVGLCKTNCGHMSSFFYLCPFLFFFPFLAHFVHGDGALQVTLQRLIFFRRGKGKK